MAKDMLHGVPREPFNISNRRLTCAHGSPPRVVLAADEFQRSWFSPAACTSSPTQTHGTSNLGNENTQPHQGASRQEFRFSVQRSAMASSMFVVVLTCIFAIAGISAAYPTAYDVLASYGFPEGLLPKIVENSGEDYSLDGSGAFELHLERPCRFTIPGSYEVKYDSRIAGSIKADRLTGLSGISVHIFYMWWNIDAITVNDKDLTFQVGPFSSSFPSENFDENPMCSGGSGHGHADH